MPISQHLLSNLKKKFNSYNLKYKVNLKSVQSREISNIESICNKSRIRYNTWKQVNVLFEKAIESYMLSYLGFTRVQIYSSYQTSDWIVKKNIIYIFLIVAFSFRESPALLHPYS